MKVTKAGRARVLQSLKMASMKLNEGFFVPSNPRTAETRASSSSYEEGSLLSGNVEKRSDRQSFGSRKADCLKRIEFLSKGVCGRGKTVGSVGSRSRGGENESTFNQLFITLVHRHR